MNIRTVQEFFTEARHFITFWPTHFETLCTGLGLGYFALAIYFMYRKKRHVQGRPDSSYQALLSVFVPTSSAWPSKHTELLNVLALPRQSRVLSVSASAIFKNVVDGVIETRNPQDLSHMLRSRLRIYGWTLHLSLDIRWRVSLLVWILGSMLPGHSDKVRQEGCSTSSANSIVFPDILFSSTGSIISSMKTHVSTSTYANPSLCLDFIAYHDVGRALDSFRCRLNKGIAGTISFTSMTSNFLFYSDLFMFCCIPFTQRKYLGPYVVQRTSTPLLLNLHSVTKALSTLATVSISSVINVSSEYLIVLRSWRHRVVNDKALRTGLVRNWGEKGWREHVFLLDWEIGLLDAGLLTRWSIVVRHR